MAKKYVITDMGEMNHSEGTKEVIAFGTELMQVSDGYHTMDELYTHRVELFITICRSMQRANEMAKKYGQTGFPVWRSWKHSDGTQYDGWFILGIFVEAGKQITYHLPASRWEECRFADFKESAPEWDGHTSADVLERLKNL